jgi:hypothetical protein
VAASKRSCPAVSDIFKQQEASLEAVLEIYRAGFGRGISISDSYLPHNFVAAEGDENSWEAGQASGPVIAGIIPGGNRYFSFDRIGALPPRRDRPPDTVWASEAEQNRELTITKNSRIRSNSKYDPATGGTG